jgi:hypothetical protein
MIATPDRHEGESFRVSHHGYWVGYVRSVAELEKWIDLADLELDALAPPPAATGTGLWPCRSRHRPASRAGTPSRAAVPAPWRSCAHR